MDANLSIVFLYTTVNGSPFDSYGHFSIFSALKSAFIRVIRKTYDTDNSF